MEQMRENADNYVWTQIKNLDELENLRMSAMRLFLADYERGKSEGRYICHELPEKLPFEDKAFDLVLSSHFLLMYTDLGYDFHIIVCCRARRGDFNSCGCGRGKSGEADFR